MFTIRVVKTDELKKLETSVLALLEQLSNEPERKVQFNKVLADPGVIFIGCFDGQKLVGQMLAFKLTCFFRTKLFIEEVVVSEEYRGQGCLRAMIDFCRVQREEWNHSQIDLTARRPGAQAAYQKLGFKNTPAFRLIYD